MAREPRIIVCSSCGNSEKHYSKGMCKKCYSRQILKKYREDNKEQIALKKKEYYEANKTRINEANARWRENNKDKIREYTRAYYENNSEVVKERSAKWQEENREKVRELKRKRYLENSETVIKRSAKWRRENLHRAREVSRNKEYRRRSRIKNTEVEKIYLSDVYELCNGVCGICLEYVDKNLCYPHPMSATIDHIVPLSKGGAHVRDNIQLAHATCNKRKAASTDFTTISMTR